MGIRKGDLLTCTFDTLGHRQDLLKCLNRTRAKLRARRIHRIQRSLETGACVGSTPRRGVAALLRGQCNSGMEDHCMTSRAKDTSFSS